MRRGQAFEVFRLLIAAVIAGAILMVLLNVLGGLTITTQDPDDFVRQAVKSMAAEGGAKTSNTIIFKPGMMVNLKAAAGAATIGSDCVKADTGSVSGWSCSDGICSYQGPKIRGYIQVVCNPPDSGSGDCPIVCTVTFKKAA